jgi:exopolysaccharide biosynthesis polyprenyl glycosylphosphotransferase
VISPINEARARAAGAAPRRGHPLTLGRAIVASDLLTLGVGGVLLPHSPVGDALHNWYLVYAALVLVALASLGAYRRRLRLEVLDDVRVVVAATAIAAMAVTSLSATIGGNGSAAGPGAFLWALGTALLLAGRWGVARARSAAAALPETASRAVVVGAGEVAGRVVKRLLKYPQFGLRPVALVGWPSDRGSAPVPVLGSLHELEAAVADAAADHVVVALDDDAAVADVVERCRDLPVDVTLAPRLFERIPTHFVVEPVGGMPLLTVDVADPDGIGFRARDALEQLLAAVLIVALAPVLAACALAVLFSLGRPILYRQIRVGRRGETFEMLKFRTMSVDPQSTAGRMIMRGDVGPGGVEGEDRRTRVGRLLRSLSLDELPQLINVIRGEMALVGPRPERELYVDAFSETVPRYPERHRVKGGITGWSQINGLRGKTSISERAECDNYYIDHWSPWLELKILVRTIGVLVRRSCDVE